MLGLKLNHVSKRGHRWSWMVHMGMLWREEGVLELDKPGVLKMDSMIVQDGCIFLEVYFKNCYK